MTNSIIETTIGCDLGDKMSAIFVLYADGKSEQHRVKTTPTAMKLFFASRPSAHVVIEVGAHSRWVNELLKRLGHRVTVANPRRVKAISESDTKTDRADAELLARLGRADVQLLAPVQHRGRSAQADLAVIKARDVLVRARSKLINHIRGVVKSFGERLPKCTAESFHRRTRSLVPDDLQPALDPLYETLDAIEQQIRTQERRIDQTAEKYPDVQVLSQPHGVGVLTALAYLLIVEDKRRFKKSRAAGAFLGLRPRKDQSGDGDPQLRITKAGDPFLRRLLVGSANHTLGPFGKDSDLRRWGLELARRGGKNARKRAKVAVARKLAVLLHRLWVTGEVYQPLGHHERSVAA
jgi:transposase